MDKSFASLIYLENENVTLSKLLGLIEAGVVLLQDVSVGVIGFRALENLQGR
jgi:hypothetical protein